jgi:two-component system cell cycle response regulator CtrA
MRVLWIALDNQNLTKALDVLKERGVVVDVARTAEDGAAFAKSYEYDLVMLGADFGGPPGLPVLAGLRRAQITTPLMVISSTSTVEAKVTAFSAGADEYMVRPVDLEELCCRLHALVRRTRGHPRSVIRVGRLEVDVEAKSVQVDGLRVPMTRMEYSILEALCLRKGSVVPRKALIEHVYGAMDEPCPKNVDVYIGRIRKKLLLLCGRSYIETEWGRGFALRDGEEEARTAA